MRDRIIERAVWPNHHGKKVTKAERRRHVEPIIVLQPNANGMNNRGIAPKCFIG